MARIQAYYFLVIAPLISLSVSVTWMACGHDHKPAKIEPVRIKAPKQSLSKATPIDRKVLWHLFGETGINIDGAWAITEGNPTMTAAILDTGFLPYSQVFTTCSNNYELLNFVGEKPENIDHGASVASLYSTCPGNPLGLLGVNNTSQVIWLEHGSSSHNALALMAWASKSFNCEDKQYINCQSAISAPVAILNASFTVESTRADEDHEQTHANFLLASQQAKKAGTILVAGAGNDCGNADTIFPHSLSGVVSAGATTKAGVAAEFSNWGETVDILAPGQELPVLEEAGFAHASGTSLASPLVAGVVSLMKSVYPDLNWKTAIYFLQSTAVPMDCKAYCVNRSGDCKARDTCENDCCRNGMQTCTPGRMNASAAVAEAKKASREGLPKVALVDSDEFFVRLLKKSGGAENTFTLRNVGGSPGSYTITTDNVHVKVVPSSIRLEKKGDVNDSRKISIFSTKANPGWINIIIKSPESVAGAAGYSDEIVISAAVLLP